MEWEQELCDLKRQLATEQALRRHVEEELELLQINEEINIKRLSKLLKEQKDDRNSMSEWKTKVETLEAQIEEERKKHSCQSVIIDKLKGEMSYLEAQMKKQTDLVSHFEVGVLQDENKDLKLNFEKLKCDYEQLVQDQMKLLKQNEEIMETNNELNNALICKREELSSYLEHSSALQEEIVLLKVENDALKSAPTTSTSKGNSVFSEVDDNRKALKNSLDELAGKYNAVKKGLKSKSAEILKLRAEKSSLLRKVQEISLKLGNNESNLLDSYKERIKDLESVVEDLKREKERVVSSRDNKALQGIFAMKNKKIEELEEKVEEFSRTSLIQNETIFVLKRDLAIQTAKAAFELTEKMLLQDKIDTTECEKLCQ